MPQGMSEALLTSLFVVSKVLQMILPWKLSTLKTPDALPLLPQWPGRDRALVGPVFNVENWDW